jgi:prepilin-type N-terminal cleavage/methylation domain-containing protein
MRARAQRRRSRSSSGSRAQRSAGQAGLTLIELMIAVVVSSILMGFVLGISAQVSSGYRQQSKVTDLSQTLRAAREAIAADARRAGYRITRLRTGTGAFGSTVTTDLPPVMVDNGDTANAPDLVRFFYADGAAGARVQSIDADLESVLVDDATGFVAGDLVVLTAPMLVDVTGTRVAEWDACAVVITGVGGATVELAGAQAPWNQPNNPHCDVPAAAVTGGEVVLHRLVARAYRIDQSRGTEGILQLSPSAGLVAGDWVDLGEGFTDLQLATRFFEDGDTADVDGDGDQERDWYAGEAQEWQDITAVRPPNAIPIELSIGVAGRMRLTTGARSDTTPGFEDPGSPLYNPVGDSPAQAVTDDWVYRASRTVVDLRNLGVGR